MEDFVKHKTFLRRSLLAITLICLGFEANYLFSPTYQTTAAKANSIQIKQRKPVVNEGNQIVLTAIDPNGQQLEVVRWKSGSPDIVQVDEITGVVKGLKRGFATVTAVKGSESASVFVTVTRVHYGKANAIPGETKIDQNGQMYISNPLQNVILKAPQVLTSQAEIFAGKAGVRGFQNGEVSQSLFSGPTAIGLDTRPGGGIFIADTLNHSLRKINYRNEVETVIGTGNPGISQFDSNGLVSFDQVQLNSPRGATCDRGGNSFLADTDNHAIYYVDYSKQMVSLLAGTPGEQGHTDGAGNEARFSRPAGLALSPDGKVLAVADQDNQRIRFLELTRLSASKLTCQVSTAGTTSRLITQGVDQSRVFVFQKPKSVSFDQVGNLNVVDETGVYIIIHPFGPTPDIIPIAQPEVSFSQPVSVTVHGNESYILDAEAHHPQQAIAAVSVGGPEITTLSREVVRAEGGEEVVVTGKNFAPESVVVVGDATVPEVQVDSATQLRFIVPQQRVHGARILSIATRGGTAQRKLSVIPKPLAELKAGEITTIAGGLTYRGDGGKASESPLSNGIQGLTTNAAGDLFLADGLTHQIRQVNGETGLITTVAGTGFHGFSGDASSALSAQLNTPQSLAIDSQGNLFIADQLNNRVRKIEALTGTITTVAGGGMKSEENIPATEALLSVNRVAIDQSDNLFISGFLSGLIHRVDAQSGLITHIAGTGNLQYSGDGGPALQAGLSPTGLAFDSSGNLYVVDEFNHRIRRIDAQTGVITTVAGTGKADFGGDGGPATSASLNRPKDIAFDSNGNLYLADALNNRIRRIDAQTGLIRTVAGEGTASFAGDGQPATQAMLFHPSGITLDGNGNLFISDQINARIRRVDNITGIITTIAGGPTLPRETLATNAFIVPTYLTIDSSENLLFGDIANFQVMQLNMQANQLSQVAGNGQNGTSGDGGPALEAGIFPASICRDGKGHLLIADGVTIRKVDSQSGIIKHCAGIEDGGFSGDGGPAKKAGMTPYHLTVDKAGNIYLSEFTRIRKINAKTKTITTLAGNGKFEYTGDGGPATRAGIARPHQIAFDQAGNVLFADTSNHCIRRIDAKTGIISTIAGTGVNGLSGDGGPAVQAALFSPTGLAIDPSGNVFIGDGNNQIRRIDAKTGIISTVAGTGTTQLSGDGDLAAKAGLQADLLFLDGAGNLFCVGSSSELGVIRVIKGAAQ